MNILVIEDDLIIKKGVTQTLTRAFPAYTIYEASSSNEALELLQAEPMNVVLTDIIIPGIDGLTFIETYQHLFLETQWIVMSGLSGDDYIRKAIQLGVADYLIKPFDKSEMLEIVRSLTESNQTN